MKKYVIKATALAIGALVGGGAFASIDFTASPVSTTGAYASEISYAKTSGNPIVQATKPTQTAVGAAAVAATGTYTTMKTKLGFGVSTGQQRYIRIDFTGVKLGAAASSDDLNDITNSFGAAGANRTVVAGGSVDDTYVIYQITGANAAGHAASNIISYAAPDLRTTAGNGTAPTITYSLYETAVAAANNVAGTSLYTTSGKFFDFSSGYTITTNAYNNTATVATGFKNFEVKGGTPTTTATKAELGNFTIVANTATVAAGTGVGVTLADLFTTGSKVVFKGDFSPKGGGAGVTVEAAGCGGAIGTSTTSVASDKQSVTWTTTAVGDVASVSLCFAQDNTVVQPAQTFTWDLNPAALNSKITLTDPAAVTIGAMLHDGTTLQAPFATIHPDYLSRVVLTSQAGADVPFTATAITETGGTCSGSGLTGTLKAGSLQVINVKDICPAISGGATRLAVQVVLATPLNTVHGVYNVMNYDQATGKTNSLISYPMVRPTEN